MIQTDLGSLIRIRITPKERTPNMCCFRIVVPLGGKEMSSHAHKTGSWYPLGVLFKLPDEQPRPFICALPPPPPVRPALSLALSLAIAERQVARTFSVTCHMYT